jgi:hypothetical protein
MCSILPYRLPLDVAASTLDIPAGLGVLADDRGRAEHMGTMARRHAEESFSRDLLVDTPARKVEDIVNREGRT